MKVKNVDNVSSLFFRKVIDHERQCWLDHPYLSFNFLRAFRASTA